MACTDCGEENSSLLPKGSTGLTGAPGTNGTNGSSFLTGSGSPGSSTGSDGDTYLDIATYNIYTKAGGSWTLVGNIKGTNGSGLIKYADTINNPSILAGAISNTITASTLSTYGIPSTSVPGSASPPVGHTYGTAVVDFVLRVYEYASSTNIWTQIPDNRLTLSINGTSGDLSIITTGHSATITAIRYLIIG